MSKKKRVGINLKPEVWELGKNAAFESHKSFSSYIEDFLSGATKVDFKVEYQANHNHRDGPRSISTHYHYAEQLDRIEEKLDQLLGDRPPVEKISRGDMVADYPHKEMSIEIPVKTVRSDDEVLKEAQAKLEKLRAEKPEGLFERNRRLNPMKRCVGCHKLNKDCECGVWTS